MAEKWGLAVIPQELSLKTVTKTSLAVIKIAVDNAVKKVEHHQFGPFALALANVIHGVVKAGAQSGPSGAWIKVKDAIPKVYPLVWSWLPPPLRSKFESFLVAVFQQLV